ncbi:LysR family transcriptional regulator [Labedella phragmitis]|uniref:LysR family transcriptional regulator n=1 Tax=Labedella phragmitis TaxID=2498849 RepID=A0A3S4BLC1_9MICO|nr:LysR family transcriptional regulator [Labedella phragmitis]RWZ52667.1 LysR family transcriptional regulator [Labedella phragmitis]
METRRLEYFVVLTSERSFGHAAARLRISQPALSQQIQRLEKDLGAKLIDRSVTPFELTQAGIKLLAHSRKLLDDLQEIDALVTDSRVGRVGRLRIGIVPSLLYGDLPAMVRSFRAQFPGIDLRVSKENTNDLVDMLSMAQMDVGLLYSKPRGEALSHSELYVDPYVVVLPSDHPLAAQDEVGLGQLQDEELLMFPRHGSPEAYDGMIAACVAAGFSPRRTMISGTTYTDQIGFVAAGLGVSLLPSRLATVRLTGVAYRPIAAPAVTSIATIVWNSSVHDPTKGIFVDWFRKRVRETAPVPLRR